MSQPPPSQSLIDTTSTWSLVFGAGQALVPGESIRDHRFGTTLDSAYLGVRKVGINIAAGVDTQFSSIQQEIEWLTWCGSGPSIALRTMSQTGSTGSQSVIGAD